MVSLLEQRRHGGNCRQNRSHSHGSRACRSVSAALHPQELQPSSSCLDRRSGFRNIRRHCCQDDIKSKRCICEYIAPLASPCTSAFLACASHTDSAYTPSRSWRPHLPLAWRRCSKKCLSFRSDLTNWLPKLPHQTTMCRNIAARLKFSLPISKRYKQIKKRCRMQFYRVYLAKKRCRMQLYRVYRAKKRYRTL